MMQPISSTLPGVITADSRWTKRPPQQSSERGDGRCFLWMYRNVSQGSAAPAKSDTEGGWWGVFTEAKIKLETVAFWSQWSPSSLCNFIIHTGWNMSQWFLEQLELNHWERRGERREIVFCWWKNTKMIGNMYVTNVTLSVLVFSSLNEG